MADLISRADAIQAVRHAWAKGLEPSQYIEIVPAMDAVPVVPVVRCRDCKYGEPTKNARGEAVIKCEEICWLCRLPRLMEPDWFCTDGERRDEDAAD